MVIAVGDSRVYKFPQSTIAAEVYNDRAEILVLPERRKFILRGERVKLQDLREVYPKRTPQNILTTIIVNALQNGFLQVDEEVG
jgi:chemotaxis protein histidine kinase CheA